MKHVIRHGLTHELAREAAQHALDSYRDRFSALSPEGEWIDDDHARVAFSAAGRRMEGSIGVGPEEIELELEVPFIFRLFHDRAGAIINEDVRRWIDRAREGELGKP